MKAGCVIFFFQVAEPGEDARCCNIPKLNGNLKAFRGPRRGSSIRQGQDQFRF